MRLAAAACALAIAGLLAVAGAVLALRSTSSAPAQSAAAPAKAAPTKAAPPAAASAGTVALASGSSRPVALPDSPSAGSTAAGLPKVAPLPAAGPAPDVILAQAPKAAAPAAVPAAPAPPPPPPATVTTSCPGNPNALGVSRVVEVDTTGGPGFGFEHFKTHDFLRDGEVVLTFDDGPWPKNTPAVLQALAFHCTKAIFFPIGLHATYEPGILKQVAAAGHAVGSHTWCHQDLTKTKGKCQINGKTQNVDYDPKDEIEMGISAVRWAAGVPTAPYFRFPALRQPPELIQYLGQRNIAIFSADFDSFDFKMRKPEQVRQSVMAKLKKNGKGIVLMHDFQHATAEAAAALLADLKAGGYKIVFMKPKDSVRTLPAYDEKIMKQVQVSSGGADNRPTSSVIKTISE